MGERYLVGTKRGMTFQIPMSKYTMLGESSEISSEEVKKIGDSLGVDWNSISATELYEGAKVEAKEHSDIVGSSVEKALRIALAHLKEIPDYYTRLKAMEAKATKPATSGNIQNADEEMGKSYEEEKHPRDEKGRWVGGGGESKVGEKDKTEIDRAGAKIVEVLNLKTNEKGRYNTSWGDKTEHGLAETLKRALEEKHNIGELLALRPNKDGMYRTSWGTKTEVGLAATVKRLLEDYK